LKFRRDLIRSFEENVNRFVTYLGTALVFLLFAIILTQVVARMFRSAFPWAEEAAQFILVCIVFIGAAVVERDDSHVRVDFLVELLPYRIKKITKLLSRILLLFALICVFYGISLLAPYVVNLTSPGGQIPLWWMYLLVGIGVAWWIVHSIYSLYVVIVSRDSINKGEE
jgi:TRAP-type C4-dicarboxylate transport system permease small subunit